MGGDHIQNPHHYQLVQLLVGSPLKIIHTSFFTSFKDLICPSYIYTHHSSNISRIKW